MQFDVPTVDGEFVEETRGTFSKNTKLKSRSATIRIKPLSFTDSCLHEILGRVLIRVGTILEVKGVRRLKSQERDEIQNPRRSLKTWSLLTQLSYRRINPTGLLASPQDFTVILSLVTRSLRCTTVDSLLDPLKG